MIPGLSTPNTFTEDSSRDADPRAHGSVACHLNAKETSMQWTTPTATDFRFGFEITMYVAAR